MLRLNFSEVLAADVSRDRGGKNTFSADECVNGRESQKFRIGAFKAAFFAEGRYFLKRNLGKSKDDLLNELNRNPNPNPVLFLHGFVRMELSNPKLDETE